MLDYGLDRVTNPNEVQVNQVGLCCILWQSLGQVLRLGSCPSVYCLVVSGRAMISPL